MRDETKEIFAAPWTIEEEAPLAWYCVIDSKDSVVANDVRDQKTVNRLARLPELYDALAEAAAGKCWSCAGESSETMLDHPCPKGHDEDCYVAKWRELLKFVRDGK